MQNLKITLIQSDIHWQDVDANLAMFEEKIWQIKEPVDVIVLPEMFNTGFTMEHGSLAEPVNGRTYRWMKQQAAQTDAVITGSLMVKDKGNKVYNRLVWMFPDGHYQSYDKRHLFRMAKEDTYFEFGKERLIVTWRGWKVCPLICYDLRFPVWSRNRGLKYDLLVYVASWPGARITAWDALLKARAIENAAYVVGMNRTGEDGNGIEYNGHSAVYSPKGETLAFAEQEKLMSVELNGEELKEFREKFPVHLDGDDFTVRV